MSTAKEPVGEWDYLAGVIYLNFAAHAALPQSVLGAAETVIAGLRGRHAVGP